MGDWEIDEFDAITDAEGNATFTCSRKNPEPATIRINLYDGDLLAIPNFVRSDELPIATDLTEIPPIMAVGVPVSYFAEAVLLDQHNTPKVSARIQIHYPSHSMRNPNL